MRASEFLTEDRNSFVADQLGDKLLQAYLIDHGQMPVGTTALDVVVELSKANPKLVQWLATRYVRGEFKFEDLEVIKQELERFKQVRARLPDEQKDLNKLSLGDLYRVLAPFENEEVVSNKQAERDKKQKFMDDGEAELIYKDKTLIVLSPKTTAASCYFGKGTKWCTAATKSENYFKGYNKKGPLYIIMTKDDGKFQIHFDSGEFNNAVNEQLKSTQIIALTTKYPKLYDAFKESATRAAYLPLIKNPAEKLQQRVIKYDGEMIKYIKNPSEAVQLLAVIDWPYAIEYIENPSEKVQIAAVKSDFGVVGYIDDPSEEVQMIAVSEYGYAIEYIENPSEKIQLAAVKNAALSIEHIEDPSEAVQLTAVTGNGYAIQYIYDATEKVELAAIMRDPEAIEYIDNPTDRVLKAAGKL